ncbi:hypothetical protein EV384_5861 [Micromonospora kangleipakensis]|uniref:Uncharacterized protein n=1 Tax=Micromonospora kangleipakensis TaxID=1077942 RepID=A0A4V6MGV7_9ACTN|nr:hypothetical protein [Micromonospora kangleipakensis]RZU77146.1 hypothetical protein EV384_5861 [Micromonospora kangleipakensis]
MTAFEEYAALARQLAGQRRGADRAATAEAERRRALHAAVDQLGQRLAAQRQLLDRLGRAIGAAASGAGPAPSGADLAAAPHTGPAPSGIDFAAQPGADFAAPGGDLAAASGSAVPSAGPASTVVGPFGPGHGGATGPGGAAAAPGRPGVGAYPQVAVAATGATPTTGAGTTGGGVPGPRAPEADPAAELAAARQLADEADRHGQQADALARRPALLPTWSPLARAAAVYTGAALAGAVLMLAMVVASGLEVVGLGALYASMCAGLPVASFVAGYLVLGRWGRPVIDGGAPSSRFVPLGFVICVLLVPLVYCAYLLAFRVLR